MASKITVGKIVASSTPTAWSQAYHAGGFTAVLSLAPSPDAKEPIEESNLHKMGKDMLDTLIAEYFTLVTKDLDTVRGAVEATAEKKPEGVRLSMVVGASVKNILYIVIVNQGKALLKRGDKVGTLLELPSEASTKAIESVSGYLEHDDVVILETAQFEDVLPQHELAGMIDHHAPQELAEMLAPKIHEAQEGGASALVFAYHEEEPSPLEKSYTPSASTNEETHHNKHEEPQEKEEKKEIKTQAFFPEEKQQKRPGGLSHTQKIFLTIAAVLTLVLIGSIYLFLSRQQTAKRQQQFTSVYQPAKAKYDEGQSLIELNQALALDDFKSAKQTLQSAQNQFPKGSTEANQIQDLLTKIDTSLQSAQQAPTVQTAKAPDGASPLLSFESQTNSTYVATDATIFYAADNTGVTTYSKGSTKGTQVIKADWKSIGGFATYLGNLYLLDQQNGITKYVPTGSTFTKTAYFAAGVSPDLSKAVSIAIDGSIWILTSDGTVTKYTRGKQDTLTLSGLNKPLSAPSVIVTSVDDNNVYIVDKGNSRLVVVKKTGEFITDYQAGIIKHADGLDVSEKDKKAYILSGGTIYQVDLK